MYKSILQDTSFASVQPIAIGDITRSKYRVKTHNDEELFLCVAPSEAYSNVEWMFNIVRKMFKAGCSIPKPVDYGYCKEGVYYILEYINGKPLAEIDSSLSEEEWYRMGLKASIALKKIHNLPCDPQILSWLCHFEPHMKESIERYRQQNIDIEGIDAIYDFLSNNKQLLEGRPQRISHRDFHMYNIMYSQDEIILVDFNGCGMSDPWVDFSMVLLTTNKYTKYAFNNGLVHGYFLGNPPPYFWSVITVYCVITNMYFIGLASVTNPLRNDAIYNLNNITFSPPTPLHQV